MRTSLPILALALGCIGCHENQIATRDVAAAEPLEDRGERPSFYESNNTAEFYGRCSKCQRWVKGYFGNWDYGDATGKLVGGGSGVSGTCEHCKAHLFTDESGSFTNKTRIVRWRAPR